ncbi:hypothetical protein [Allocoleopsis sp.]|uniref:hypothetical protein n=1 Tax=Allocoleopsis sp. TaxID=3088169 RepID=UPI002FD253BB
MVDKQLSKLDIESFITDGDSHPHYDQNGQLHAQTTSSQEKLSVDGQAIAKLISTLRGELILPGNPTYEAERRVWNGAFDCHPAAIARCIDAEDVRAAVNLAREQPMTLSVRSGGHSLAGHGTKAAPNELSTEAVFALAPPAPFIPPDKQGTPVIGILVCYTGNLSEGERVVAPLRQLATPIADTIAPMPYPDIFAFNAIGEVRGMQHHAR